MILVLFLLKLKRKYKISINLGEGCVHLPKKWVNVTMVTEVMGLWGYQPVNFFLRIFYKRLRGYQGYRSYGGYAGHQRVLSSSNPRLQGCKSVEFFPKYSFNKRLRGYQGYQGYRGYDGPPSRGPILIKFKVTRLQGYQWVEFFSSNF